MSNGIKPMLTPEDFKRSVHDLILYGTTKVPEYRSYRTIPWLKPRDK